MLRPAESSTSSRVQAVDLDPFAARTGHDQADNFIALLNRFYGRGTGSFLVMVVGIGPGHGFDGAETGDGL